MNGVFSYNPSFDLKKRKKALLWSEIKSHLEKKTDQTLLFQIHKLEEKVSQFTTVEEDLRLINKTNQKLLEEQNQEVGFSKMSLRKYFK